MRQHDVWCVCVVTHTHQMLCCKDVRSRLPLQWQPNSDILTGYTYIIPTHGMHQWLLLQFLVLLMMDAEIVRNM